jgi:hypothetical protein
MEVPTEALAAAGGAVTVVVGALWWQVRDRIRTLERSLAKAMALIDLPLPDSPTTASV